MIESVHMKEDEYFYDLYPNIGVLLDVMHSIEFYYLSLLVYQYNYQLLGCNARTFSFLV